MTVSTTNTDHSLSDLKLFLPNSEPAPDELPHPCEELAKSFEAATGWVLGFQESSFSPAAQASVINGPDSDQANTVRLGKIKITDLSADWPARKPAASRRKCDEMAAAIDRLFNELNRTRLELQTAEMKRAGCSFETNAEKQTNSFLESESAERTSTSGTSRVARNEAAQITVNDLPFAGWKAEVRNQPGSYAGWFINSDEQLVAISIYSTKNDCESTCRDVIARATESAGCDFVELVESLELALKSDLETAGVELVFAIADPLAGEVSIQRAGRQEETETGEIVADEAEETIPVSIFEVAHDESQDENKAHEWVEYINGDYFGFLSHGNSLALGGSIGSCELSQIVISRA